MLRKVSLSFFLALLMTCTVFAQGQVVDASSDNSALVEVTGRVVDKKGSPIPGVRVQASGTDVFCVTELDGSFRLLVPKKTKKVQAFYAGMVDQRQRIEPEMEIVMRKETFWNAVPHQAKWFVLPQVIFPESGFKNPTFGIMAGRVKRFGWYGKAFFKPGVATLHEFSSDATYWTTGEEARGFWGILGGGVFRAVGPLHVYAGGGYEDFSVAWQLADGSYARNLSYSYRGLTAEAGIMLKLGRVNINGGTIFMGDWFSANFGVGVNF